MRFQTVLTCVLVSLSVPSAAGAERDPAYLGVWIIAGSQPAPWVQSSAEVFEQERAALTGARIVFARGRIAGPAPFACARPRYAMRHSGPELLFQGGLTDAAAQAAMLGFASGEAIPTLETGCGAQFEYHFRADGTAMVAFDNAIYRLRKAR